MRAASVILLTESFLVAAQSLSEQFEIPLIDGRSLVGAKPKLVDQFIVSQFESEEEETAFAFVYVDSGLSLAQVSGKQTLRIHADFCSPAVNYRRRKGGGKGQLIAKAVGVGSDEALSVLDATAGLGGDAFVLASLGCDVTLVERVPEVRALLRDGLRVAKEWGAENDPTLLPILERMHLIEMDAFEYFQTVLSSASADVVYLDPMFPVRSKSALVKKEMQVFHNLVGNDPDADGLLALAIAHSTKRVVVKRPRVARPLDDAAPIHSLEGKRNRFDVYSTVS